MEPAAMRHMPQKEQALNPEFARIEAGGRRFPVRMELLSLKNQREVPFCVFGNLTAFWRDGFSHLFILEWRM
jgi:hypothetical protein